MSFGFAEDKAIQIKLFLTQVNYLQTEVALVLTLANIRWLISTT